MSLSLVYCLIAVSEFSYLFIVIDINSGTSFSNDLSFVENTNMACSFLDFTFVNEQTNMGRNKYTSNYQAVLRSVQLVRQLSRVVANFTHEIEVSTLSIKFHLSVCHEMMVQLVVLYSFFIRSLHVRDLKKAFLLSRISPNTFCWLFFCEK